MEDEIKTTKKKLADFCSKALIKTGINNADAQIAAEVLSTNDMRGVTSHGTVLLHNYIKQIKAGGIDPAAKLSVVKEGDAWALVDGKRGLGVVTAYKAAKIAAGKARESGIAAVSVKGGNHAAALGYYAMMCAEENMAGIAMSNGNPVMSVAGTTGRVMGNNPFAYAVPAGKYRAVFFDVAMSVISGGKIKNFEKEGKKLPQNWMIDRNGNPATDPAVFRQGGTLLPFALHKGYGFAVMVECLAAVLSGAGFLGRNVDWVDNPSFHSDIGHMFIAIDVKKFIPRDEFEKRMETLVEELHNAPRAKGTEKIYLPGEMEIEKEQRQQKDGLKLEIAVYSSIKALSEDLGMEEEFKKVFA